jgi:hypothetical protein
MSFPQASHSRYDQWRSGHRLGLLTPGCSTHDRVQCESGTEVDHDRYLTEVIELQAISALR